MEELMTAIDTIADADAALRAALTGGLWREHAPQRVVMSDTPYGRYFVVSLVPRPWASSDHQEYLIQFDMFTKSPDSRDAWDCHDKLILAFPNALCSVKTTYTYMFWLGFSDVLWEEGEVYHVIVEYRVQAIPN